MGLYDSVLIIGGRGMLAQAIARALTLRSRAYTALDLPDIDITKPDSVRDVFARFRPTLAINCAAYTNVDKCEIETKTAVAVNGEAVGTLAEEARRYGGVFVHYSTDFVFDGKSDRSYRPDDPTNPLSAYGMSKLIGEQRAGTDALIIRTAWLYGPGGACFPRTMVEAARAKKPLNVVSDQIGSPTYTRDLAEATLNLVDVARSGIYHVTNVGSVSWFDFTRAILEEFDEPGEVKPITAADWKKLRPQSAYRPAYSVMDVSAYESATGHRMRPWRVALRDYRRAVAEAGF